MSCLGWIEDTLDINKAEATGNMCVNQVVANLQLTIVP